MIAPQGPSPAAASANPGDPTTAYPDASSILQDKKANQPADPQAMAGGQLASALQTLTKVVMGLEQRGLPGAEEAKQHLVALAQSIQKAGQGGQAGQPPQGAEPAAEQGGEAGGQGSPGEQMTSERHNVQPLI